MKKRFLFFLSFFFINRKNIFISSQFSIHHRVFLALATNGKFKVSAESAHRLKPKNFSNTAKNRFPTYFFFSSLSFSLFFFSHSVFFVWQVLPSSLRLPSDRIRVFYSQNYCGRILKNFSATIDAAAAPK